MAYLWKIISTYTDESTLWNQMGQETGYTLHMANPSNSLVIFHDEGYKESDVETVQRNHENTENVVLKTVEPIEIASAVYKGSYDQINEANEAVAALVSNNSYDYDDPMFLLYYARLGPVTIPILTTEQRWFVIQLGRSKFIAQD